MVYRNQVRHYIIQNENMELMEVIKEKMLELIWCHKKRIFDTSSVGNYGK